ncbi:MAG TPA: 2-oxo acid dehydrogenase subunit E2 [Candidatus Melainabacteria bacterium]|nr:2-oxo acid dehydrogenase subunit E2 [Candidatus Melainabacteria bacterium]HIN66385.1 2-oxo acid dehydrogenase subunit E2 [Candidatus Obscuribacterales bacterium]
MSVEFKLPDLGEGIHEAEVIAVKVKEGETVKEDQPILEVETDKAVVEIPCPVAGVVEKVNVKAGETVKTGQVMMSFITDGAKAPATAEAKTEAKAEQKHAVGALAAAASGAVAPQARTMGGDHIGNGKVPAAPAVRRLARELGIDLTQVPGSGPAGRVLNEDVRSYAAGKLEGHFQSGPQTTHAQSNATTAQSSSAPAKATGVPPCSLKDKYGDSSGERKPLDVGGGGGLPAADLPDFTKYGATERVPLKSIRRKIAENMTISWTRIPHVTHFDEADVTSFEPLRVKHDPKVNEQGGRLTLTVLTLKAVVSGLKKYPQFNASLDEKNGEIVFKHYYNIGIAVATERGLIVPVIKNVDQKSIIELARELKDIAEKTRTGKIELDRLQGGTFTITNIGAIGGTSMSPMINYPECAILGMARAAEKPVVRQGKIEIGTIMPLALSFDHRIADGAEAAYFVRHIIERLEDPFTLLLEA